MVKLVILLVEVQLSLLLLDLLLLFLLGKLRVLEKVNRSVGFTVADELVDVLTLLWLVQSAKERLGLHLLVHLLLCHLLAWLEARRLGVAETLGTLTLRDNDVVVDILVCTFCFKRKSKD